MFKEDLIRIGFAPKTFYYQIGGGEDEDDREIFIRGEQVVFWDKWTNSWRKTERDKCNYVNGLPKGERVTLEEL